MKFFNIDLHISVIEDIKYIFTELGHEVTSWNLSGHNWVFERSPTSVDIINQNTWKCIDQNMCDKFYEHYKDELSEYDGFIACYPPVFAFLYEKFNKPIFIVAATRYEYPFSHNEDRWSWLDNKLKYMIDNGQIIPIANNKYDKLYSEYFLEKEFTHIPSLCEYTNCKYTGSNLPIVAGRTRIQNYRHITDLKRFKWEDLYDSRAIIHIPYNVSIMSIFEQYSAGVPLFFPTVDFGKKIQGYLSELLFMPNVRFSNALITNSAISLSDFYDEEWMPFIEYYNSFDELNDRINSLDLLSISNSMKRFNIDRKLKIQKLWSSLICRVK